MWQVSFHLSAPQAGKAANLPVHWGQCGLQQWAPHTAEQLSGFSQWRKQNLHTELICFSQLPVVPSKLCSSSTDGSSRLSVHWSAPPKHAHRKASLKPREVFQNSDCKHMRVHLSGAWSWNAVNKWWQSGHLPCKWSESHWLACREKTSHWVKLDRPPVVHLVRNTTTYWLKLLWPVGWLGIGCASVCRIVTNICGNIFCMQFRQSAVKKKQNKNIKSVCF